MLKQLTRTLSSYYNYALLGENKHTWMGRLKVIGREKETIKKSNVNNFKTKNYNVWNIFKILDGLNKRLEMAEEIINENRSIEINQYEEESEND